MRNALLPYAMISCLSVAGLTTGCKATTGGGGASRGHPTYLYTDAGFVPKGTIRVPVIEFVSTAGDPQAADIFYQILEDALRDKPEYVVVSKWSIARDATRKNLGTQLADLAQQWRESRSFNTALLREVGGGLGVSHVAGGEVSEWLTEEVDWQTEGYSNSDVAAMLQIISVETGAIVWEVRDKVQVKSPHYDPSAGQSRADELGIKRGQAKVVPPAPPIEDTAVRVARNLVASLP